MLWAPCDSRLSNWSCFSAYSWTKSFSSSFLHLSWAFLFSADENARREEDGVDAGIELSSLNWRDSGNESVLVVEGNRLGFPRSLNMDPSWWMLWIFVRKKLVARTRIHVVGKWDRDQFYREVYRIETLLHITCQIISESKHPRFCFPRFVSIWPAPEVVDGIFEVCTAATKFCPLVNKPVALGFSLWWQLFDISKQFCPLVWLGPKQRNTIWLRSCNVYAR